MALQLVNASDVIHRFALKIEERERAGVITELGPTAPMIDPEQKALVDDVVLLCKKIRGYLEHDLLVLSPRFKLPSELLMRFGDFVKEHRDRIERRDPKCFKLSVLVQFMVDFGRRRMRWNLVTDKPLGLALGKAGQLTVKGPLGDKPA